MIGEPLQQVGKGIRSLMQTLRTDPYALETVYLSVIVFAGRTKTLVSLTDLVSFYPPQLPVGGGTSLSAALRHLMREMESTVVKTSAETKGDWKPIIFLFTDGAPTDDTEAALQEWEAKYRARTNLVAISVGNNADAKLLGRLTDQVLLLNDAYPESYQRFFKWITASIQTQSQKVETSANDQFQVEKLDGSLARKVDLSKPPAHQADENLVVLNARCQKTGGLYLIKFKRQRQTGTNVHHDADWEEWPDVIGETEEPISNARAFALAGAFPVPSLEDYNELTATPSHEQNISTAELQGAPSCPCCGNQFGFSTCACGGIHCSHGPGVNVCPWCGKTGTYEFGTGDSDVSRALG